MKSVTNIMYIKLLRKCTSTASSIVHWDESSWILLMVKPYRVKRQSAFNQQGFPKESMTDDK